MYLIVRDASVEVSAGVGVHPAPVEILKLEVLWGQGVARQISLLPLPVLWLQRFVAPAPSLCPTGFCWGRGGDMFPPLCVPRSFPPLFVRATLFPSPSPSVTLVVPALSAARHVESEAQCWCTDPDIGMTRR